MNPKFQRNCLLILFGTVFCLVSCGNQDHSSEQGAADHTEKPVSNVKNAGKLSNTPSGMEEPSSSKGSDSSKASANRQTSQAAQPGTNGGASNPGNGRDNSHVPQKTTK